MSTTVELQRASEELEQVRDELRDLRATNDRLESTLRGVLDTLDYFGFGSKEQRDGWRAVLDQRGSQEAAR